MEFTLEQIDVKQIKNVYLLRGYDDLKEDHYCFNLVLMQNLDNSFSAKLALSDKTLTISDGKDLFKYLKKVGVKFTADVLQDDFDRFYNTRGFKRIQGE